MTSPAITSPAITSPAITSPAITSPAITSIEPCNLLDTIVMRLRAGRA